MHHILVMVVTCLGWSALGLDRNVYSQLRRTLLEDYSADAPPLQEGRGPPNLTMEFHPFSVLNLDLANSVLTIAGLFKMYWFDSLLAWNSSEYGDLSKLLFTKGEIWTPKWVLFNSVDSQVTDTVLQVKASGDVKLYTVGTFRTKCQVDSALFPFDTQHCSLTLIPVQHCRTIPKILFEMTAIYGDNSSEWLFLDSKASVDPREFSQFTLSMKRRATFYVTTILFPMCLLSLFNACVFLLPAAEADKMSYLISIFVSYAVFLIFVNDVLPKSATVSRMTIYLILILSQSCVSILCTIFFLNKQTGSINTCFRCVQNSAPPMAERHCDVIPEVKTHSKEQSKSSLVIENGLFGLFILWWALSLAVFLF